MENYITMGLNIALLVFIFFGIFWGFIRGLRKSACRSIFLIITTIILILVTPLITKALLGIKFNVVIEQKEATLSGSHNIKEIISFFMEQYLGKDFVTSYPEFAEFIISLPLLLVNAIIYVVLFWISKYLLYPLNYLLYRIAFAPRRKKETLGFSNFDNNENPFEDAFKETPAPQESAFVIENKENMPNANIDNSTTNTPTIEQTTAKTPTTQQPASSEVGMFIIKDPEYNKHQKLTEEIKELTEKADKKEKKIQKKQAKKEYKKIKKYRLLGGLMGAVCGLTVMLNTLIPIYGVMEILNDANKVEIDNLTDEKLSLNTLTDGLTDEIINGYNNSILNIVSKYSGLKGLGLATFDSLTTTKHNDTKITLREDIDSVVTTIEKADNLIGKYKEYAKDGNLADLTKEEISTLLTDTKTLLSDTKKIKVVNVLSDYLIPIAGNYLLKSETKFTDNATVNKLIANLIVDMLESSGIDLFEEVNSLVDVAEYLNEQDLLTAILQDKFDDPITIIKNLDNNFANTFTEKLYKLKLVNTVLPHVLNISMTILDTTLDFGYVENSATSEQIKSSVTNFLNKALSFGKTLDSDSSYYITTNSLIPLGEFMDSIKSSYLINSETYQNALNFVKNKLSGILNEIIPEDLQKSINGEVLGNLNRVHNWQQEMTLINQAITLLRHKSDGFIGTAVEGEDLREGLSINLELSNEVLTNLGKAFDVLEKSILFGSPNVRLLNIDGNGNKEYTLSTISYVMCDLIEYIKNESLTADGFEELNEFILKIENNLISSNHTYNSEIKFWENEFRQTAPLIVELSTTLKSEEFSISSTLGSKLDKAKTSVLFGNGACLTLINNALTLVKDNILSDSYDYNDGSNIENPQTLDDKIYELFDGIETKLNTNQIKNSEKDINNFWTTEIDKYLSLIEIADKATSLNEINDAIILGKDLDNAFDSYTIPKLELSKTFAFAIKDVKRSVSSPEDYINIQINQTIDNIASKLENESFVNSINENNFWQIELEYIAKVTDIDFDNDLVNNLKAIGVTLDEVTDGYIKVTLDDPKTAQNESKEEYIRPSKLITHEDIRLLLSSAIKECKSSLTNSFTGSTKNAVENALTTISTNIENAEGISFEFELEKLQTLSNLDVSSSYFQKGETAEEESANREGLEELGNTLDLISFNVIKAQASSGSDIIDVYIYNESLNSKVVTRQVISTLIIDIIDNAKKVAVGTTPLSINDNAYNGIIESIKSRISSASSGDFVYSWLRELGFINKLTQLEFKNGLEYNTIAENIGSVLDGIAFNQGFHISGDYLIYDNNFGDIKFVTLNTGSSEIKAIYSLPGDIFYDRENDTTYGNSLFITREALLAAVKSMISDLKEDDLNSEYEYDKEDIINELLDNVTTNVATTDENYVDSNYYKNTTDSFNDLTSIKKIIDTSLNIGSMKLSEINAANIDKKLSDIQALKISGVITTRKMAIYVLDSLADSMDGENLEISVSGVSVTYTFTDHPAGKYLITLRDYYKNRDASDTDKVKSEEYQLDTTTTTPTTSHPNPFVSLKDRVDNCENYLDEINP